VLKGHRRSLTIKRRVLSEEGPAHEVMDAIFVKTATGTLYRLHGSCHTRGSGSTPPEMSRRRSFGLTVLARLGKYSYVQKAVVAILHTSCERAARAGIVLICPEGKSPSTLAAPDLEVPREPRACSPQMCSSRCSSSNGRRLATSRKPRRGDSCRFDQSRKMIPLAYHWLLQIPKNGAAPVPRCPQR
jgi:hypothetical protein